MKKFFYLAAAFITAAACSREPIIPEQPTAVEKGPFSVTLVAGSPETRTELGEDNGKMAPFWSEGDCISVITIPGTGEENAYYTFDGELENGGRTARFHSEEGQFASFVACYPSSARIDSGEYGFDEWDEEMNEWCRVNPRISFSEDEDDNRGTIEFEIPSVQYPTPTSFDPAADFMVSEPFEITEDNLEFQMNENNEIIGEEAVLDVAFSRMNAIVKIVLLDKTQQHRLTGQTVRSVTLSLSDPSMMGGGGELNAPRTRAEVWDNDGLVEGGLSGSVRYPFPVQEGEDGYYVDNASCKSVTAKYVDETYRIGEAGAATYLITVPRILKNQDIWDYNEDGDYAPTGAKDGLYIQVETDNLIIVRKVELPDAGLALQPSRVTTLNISLKDETNGTSIMEKGISFEENEVTLMPGDDMEFNLSASNITFPRYDINSSSDFWDYFSFIVTDEQGEECQNAVYLEYVTGEDTGYEYSTWVSSSQIEGLRIRIDENAQGGDYTLTMTYDEQNSASCTVHVITSSPFIEFAETEADLKRICVQYWDLNDDGEFSEYEASRVDDLSSPQTNYASVFQGENITSFSQFKYFTGLKEVYYRGFKGCPLTTITLPENIERIGYEAFAGCPLTSIVFPSSTYSISGKAFSDCTSLKSVVFSGKAVYLSDGAFQNCQSLASVIIPADASCSIDSNVFKGCYALKSITLPSSGEAPLREIGASAFVASGLTSIEIPASVYLIKNYAFHDCQDLQEVILHEGLKEIWSYAFWKCWGLHEIVFPSTLTKISGDSVFYEVTFRSGTDNEGNEYHGVKFLGSTPPSFNSSSISGEHWESTLNDGEGGWASGVTIHVPRGSKSAYEAISNITDNGLNTIVEFD